MKVLLACCHSVHLKRAIKENGHTVISCDFFSSLDDIDHYQGNVLDILHWDFDLMIAFPPCTYLCKAQLWRCNRDIERALKRDLAVEFVRRLFGSGIPRIALENPDGYLSAAFRPPDQRVHPWFFGDPYSKDVGLWLKGLPPLISTLYNPIRKPVRNHVNGRMSQDLKSRIKSNWDLFPLMSRALADQWCPPDKI